MATVLRACVSAAPSVWRLRRRASLASAVPGRCYPGALIDRPVSRPLSVPPVCREGGCLFLATTCIAGMRTGGGEGGCHAYRPVVSLHDLDQILFSLYPE